MDIDELSSKIAKDCGVSEVQVQQINRSQWRFLLDTIQSGSFDPVTLIYLGKFYKNNKYNEQGKKYSKYSRRLEKLSNQKSQSGDAIS